MPLLTTAVDGGDVTVAWPLDAARVAAWGHLVDPAVLPLWLGQPVVAELWPGGQLAVDHGQGYVCQSVLDRLEPGLVLVMSWRFHDEPETQLTIEIKDDPPGTGCVLRLWHTGLGELAPSYRIGWLVHLTYFEAAVHGTPLPHREFWNLHATLATLATLSAPDVSA